MISQLDFYTLLYYSFMIENDFRTDLTIGAISQKTGFFTSFSAIHLVSYPDSRKGEGRERESGYETSY